MKRSLCIIISGLSLFMLAGCGTKQQTPIAQLEEEINFLQIEIEVLKKALLDQEGQLIALGIFKEPDTQTTLSETSLASHTLNTPEPTPELIGTSNLTPETLVKESIVDPIVAESNSINNSVVKASPVTENATVSVPVTHSIPDTKIIAFDQNVSIPEQNVTIDLPQSVPTTAPVMAMLTPTERVAQQTTPIVFSKVPIDTAGIESLRSLTELQAYDKALSFYRTGKFIEAEKAFDLFLDLYPESRYAPNALYWKGESFYARAMYPEAIMSFKDVQARFPQHIKTADALLKTALSYQKLQDNANAALHTTVLYEDWPNSDAAQRGKVLNLKTL